MVLSSTQYVVLEVAGGVNDGCGDAQNDFYRNLPDGTNEGGPGGAGWRVPVGQALVITDVDWQYIHPDGAAAAGIIETLRLYVERLGDDGGSQIALDSAITLSSQGQGGISEAMTTGFVVLSNSRICPDISPGPQGPPSGLQHLILRGYLIADMGC